MTKKLRDKLKKILIEDKWESDSFKIKHIDSGLQLWVANGMFFLGVHDFSAIAISFSIIDKILLWPVVNRCVDRIALEKLTCTEEQSKISSNCAK